MIEKIKKMPGMQRVIFETFCVMIMVNIIFAIIYWISGNIEIAVIGIFAFGIIAFAFSYAVAANFVIITLVGFIMNLDTVLHISIFSVFGIAYIVSKIVAKKYRVGCQEVLIIYFVEGISMYISFTFLISCLG